MCPLSSDSQPTGVCFTALFIIIIPYSITIAYADKIAKLHLSFPLTNSSVSFACPPPLSV